MRSAWSVAATQRPCGPALTGPMPSTWSKGMEAATTFFDGSMRKTVLLRCATTHTEPSATVRVPGAYLMGMDAVTSPAGAGLAVTGACAGAGGIAGDGHAGPAPGRQVAGVRGTAGG